MRARILGIVINYYGLDKGDYAPVRFDALSHDKGPVYDITTRGVINEDMREWWRTYVAELGLRGDEDALLSMVQLIQHWKPDSDTPLWPEPK